MSGQFVIEAKNNNNNDNFFGKTERPYVGPKITG